MDAALEKLKTRGLHKLKTRGLYGLKTRGLDKNGCSTGYLLMPLLSSLERVNRGGFLYRYPVS
jgi:hypothetical protein